MEHFTAEKNLEREQVRSIRERFLGDNQAYYPDTLPVSTLADQYPQYEELNFNHTGV